MSTTPNPKVNIPHADIPKAVPPRSRVPLMLGLAGAGALGYYFYSAGGDPNVAKKTFQHDASSASAVARDEIPGREKEVKKSAEEKLARVGNTADHTVQEGKQRIQAGVQHLDESKERAKHTVLGKIDEADRKIEAEASNAKGGIMSWFRK